MRTWRIVLLAAMVLLTGCAGMWRVTNDVQSFASWLQVPSPPTRFRFERLPSQQATPQAQTALEQMALPALAQVGLVPDPQTAAYSLQLSTQLQENTRWDDLTMGGGNVFFSTWVGGRGGQIGFMAPLWQGPQRNFRRQVSLVLRDLATGQVVYETRASYDSRFFIGADVLPAMVAAALQGFPQPPPGPRTVTIDIPH